MSDLDKLIAAALSTSDVITLPNGMTLSQDHGLLAVNIPMVCHDGSGTRKANARVELGTSQIWLTIAPHDKQPGDEETDTAHAMVELYEDTLFLRAWRHSDMGNDAFVSERLDEASPGHIKGRKT